MTNFELVETVTIGSGGASRIEITNIPQDAHDLLFLFSTRASGSDVIDIAGARFNNDSSSLYDYIGFSGRTTSGITNYEYNDQGGANRLYLTGGATDANCFGANQLYISNYTSSTPMATARGVSSNLFGETSQWLTIYKYEGGPITQYYISQSFVEHTTMSLFKITTTS